MEIEVKVIEINKEEIIKKLKLLNAEKIGEYEIESVFFDDVNNSFSKKKNLIRLRKKNDLAFFTFKEKEKKSFARMAEEIEFSVGDFEKAKLFMEKLWFVSREVQKKHRTTFKLKNSLIEIDEYKDIPAFLEIESPSEEEIKEIIELLKIDASKVRTWNGFDLFKYYGKNTN